MTVQQNIPYVDVRSHPNGSVELIIDGNTRGIYANIYAALEHLAMALVEVDRLRIERDDAQRTLCDYQLANIGQEFIDGMAGNPTDSEEEK